MRLCWGEIIRFGIVGVIATALHYGAYYMLLFCVSPNIAYTIGWIVSLVCNLILSSRFTFRRKITPKRTGGFIASHMLNYVLHIALFNGFLALGLSPVIAPLFVYLIVVPINFILIRYIFHNFT